MDEKIIRKQLADEVKEGLNRLGNLQNNFKFIYVTGTVGKGSTCAMISKVLEKAGYKVGTITSPQILNPREGIKINSKPISETRFDEIHDYVLSKRVHTLSLFFIALKYFLDEQCDIVVMECGVGVADDSSNFIDKTEISIMTNTGLNHQDLLGDTLEEIINNKKEVIKPNCDFILYDFSPMAEEITKQKCEETNSNFHKVDFNQLFIIENSLEHRTFFYKDYQDLEIPLYGESQIKNACVVIEAIEALRNRGWNISDKALYEGLYETKMIARFETLCENPKIIFNGGGKSLAIENLKAMLNDYYLNKNIYIIFNANPKKDPAEIVKYLDGFNAEFYFIDDLENKCNGRKLHRKYNGISYYYDSLEECLNETCKRVEKNNGIIIVAGPYLLYEGTLNYIKNNFN